MANEEHLVVLRQGIEVWNQWRKDNRRILPVLCEVNLSRENICGVDLNWVIFRDTNLGGANLSGANLSGANLSGANLYEAYLCKADLSQANLSEANLSETNLSRANLSETNLSRANLYGAYLCKANLSEANLSKANLSEANLSKANLSEANLSEANLSEANLSEANLSEANLSEANLSEANLSGINLNRANLNRANLSEANLSGTNLSGANLSEANLSGTNLSGANLSEANLSETNLYEADLNEVDLTKAVFSGSSAHYFPPVDNIPAPTALHQTTPLRNTREFFDILGKDKKNLKKKCNKLFSFDKNFIPGIILYTEEDSQLLLYIKENFESLDKLTGDWCTIFVLECPPLGWEKSRLYWKEIFENELYERFQFLNLLKNKPYKKSEAYDIARKLNIDVKNLPCLVLLNPNNLLNAYGSSNEYALVDKLVFRIKEVSPEYFRSLFFALEEKAINSQSTFENIKINIPNIMKFLKNSEKEHKASNKVPNYYISKSQFAGGIVNAETINSHQIGGDIYNTDNQERSD